VREIARACTICFRVPGSVMVEPGRRFG